ncbi:MAG: Crp/Fnr family transcriptional regulator [Cyclobacteriaceae bacterium]
MIPNPEDLEQVKEYIGRFISFTDEQLNAFLQATEKKRIPKGSYLMEGGQICDYVAFINKGHFRTYCIVNQEEVTYNFFFEGNFFTDYPSFLTRQPSLEYHQALVDSEVLIVSYEKMQQIYAQVPAWEKFGRLIAEFILIRIADRNRAMLFLSPEDQYLDLMKTRPKIFEKIPQHYIASYLGIQPESLSRIRKRLSESKK